MPAPACAAVGSLARAPTVRRELGAGRVSLGELAAVLLGLRERAGTGACRAELPSHRLSRCSGKQMGLSSDKAVSKGRLGGSVGWAWESDFTSGLCAPQGVVVTILSPPAPPLHAWTSARLLAHALS